MLLKVAIAFVVEAAVFAAILFGAAGTWDWSTGWLFLALFFGPAALATLRLARDDPALLEERMRITGNPGQPLWDKIFLAAIAVLFLAGLALMGLDARFGWTSLPIALQAFGIVLMPLGIWIVDRVFAANTFAAPVVKTQAERGQHVISTGPYAIVRHPMYSGAALLLFGSALVLNSGWGVLGAFALVLAVAWRAMGEERTLAAELDGYAAYMKKLRWRLVPGVW
jgi:protein-S-isoprenylcysteine O-methyltransferase Ste14